MRKVFSVLSLILLNVIFAYGQPALDIPLTANDSISSNNGLAIGFDTSATNGIDPILGESDLPPFPPSGVFEVRFDLTPYAGEPLSTYKDYRNAHSLPYTGVSEHKLIWQLSIGATTFQIGYNLPPEATMIIKDLIGGILFNSGPLTGNGTYSVPAAFINLNAALITMTVRDPCPVLEASNPSPAELQTNVQINGNSLEWLNGAGTVNVEVWFGPNQRALKLYDGPAINSWPLGALNYGTLYSWYVVCKNDFCGVQSPKWSFTTVQDTNLVIDTINVYPKNLNNWTGSCNTSNKTQISLVNGYNNEVGWMVFDVSAIPNNVVINSVIFNGFLFDNSWPYWSITPMGNVDPVTYNASSVFNQVSTHSAQGIAYSYNEEAGTLANGWINRNLGSTVTLDLQNSLSKNWFALGILDFDFSNNYFVKFHGWAEANRPYLKVIYSFHSETTFQFSLDVQDGWNFVSIPGLLPGNQSVDSWWLFRDPGTNVFEFVSGSGYVSKDTVHPTAGYWMKHSGTRTYNTGDEWPVEGIRIVSHDPINAVSGWNIFGVYEETVAAAGLTTLPSGSIGGPVFGFSGGYYIANQLVPAHAYWVKLNNDAQIILPDASLKSNNKEIKWLKDDWGKIIISDAAGKKFTLYTVNELINFDPYELPPTPPSGIFDVRFSNGNMAENIHESVKTVEMSGVTYPLTLRVEGTDIRLLDETGKLVNLNLKSGEDVVISDAAIQKLLVSGNIMPENYVLEQNYPNPFNPSTKIEFSLPKDVNNATLTIFNILGQRVAELVNSKLQAGYYSYVWDVPQSGIATGMYIYELRADNFVSVKKMIFMK